MSKTIHQTVTFCASQGPLSVTGSRPGGISHE